MRMHKWMSGNTLKDRIKNGNVWCKLEVALKEDKMKETILRWVVMYKKGL